ncbi:hypothetical protein SMACR_04349 [Sordaria macrospora]|uniref:LRG1 protein n=2 Tax=Sordaria macrospora TaxID=5147 RepID=A0A8S8ZY15_SORMA|nr:putative LRG1 protein [Sordaria macrospora k-hell]KAA8635767.1 hypothetical protein SMACR_04349 [Sordaria macrospora]KAH7626491.1 putative LRG1 protein [Sordaria sp. MPI-SDFR-AT-0083]WPJ57959.1 hypothetical protein SMAC4_04349 [Sordaria macrospora]CCC04982.1 putative LRG1 protein [Sordaria macrospora k-hell]
MASSDYGGGPVGDREFTHGHPQGHPQGEAAQRREDEHLDITQTISQNGAPTNAHLARIPGSPALSATDATDLESRRSGDKNRSKPKGSRTASGQVRVCKKCGEPLTGQFVRALDGTFHLDCFKCRDCGQIVASKFFPADDNNGEGQYPLCETDYFRRLGLLCYQCGGALRGSYITALDRKYHVDHFTCSLCPTVFGAQDSYYEHDGHVYCHYHYSTQYAQRCSGCQTAILKQFVEIFRNGQNQHWHPECYMIHKFWNVRLNPPQKALGPVPDDPAGRELVRDEEERMEEKVYRIWSVLSTFEESSAACISDMLLHVSNGAYVDGVMVAKKFIWHVDILFHSADRLDATMARLDMTGLMYGREAKLLCKKIVAFFSLLSKTQDKGTRKLGVTQELLTLVTGLAHYLKLLIRICLQGALRIEKERDTAEGLYGFLDELNDLEALKTEDNSTTTLQLTSGMARLSASDSDSCTLCKKPIEDECAKSGEKRWHITCVNCSRCQRELGRSLQDARLNLYDSKIFCNNCETYSSDKAPPFERVSKLQQYMFLLQVALARLLEILRMHGALPSAAESRGHNGNDAGEGRPSLDGRQRGFPGGDQSQHHRESSYESALNDVKRLKSTRLDKHLSSSFRKARTSRIMDGPESSSAQPGSGPGSGINGGPANGRRMRIEEDMGTGGEDHDMMLPNQDALTLADIPRIVAAEQAREQRAGPPSRQELLRSPATEPSFGGASSGSGHKRSYSDSKGGDPRAAGEPSPQRVGRRYFSELSALEYFIVRHLAVVTMAPMVEGEFTLVELIGLIETRKTPNFWKNIGKAFQKDGRKKKGVFGVPLEAIIERDGAESTDGVGPGTLRIPAVVDDILSLMRQMDLSVEGVFRKNGNIKKLGELVEKIDKEGNVDLSGNNVVQVAALLKRYLRELPDPLMTQKLYRLWLAAAKIADEDKKRQCLHLICCLMPKCHRDSMEILFCFLKWAGSFHQVDEESGSKMDIKNLATVIAPNVLFDRTTTSTLGSDPMYAIEAVEVLIANIEEMCLVPDELVQYISDPAFLDGELTTKEILKRYSERNTGGFGSRQYADVVEIVGRHENPSRPPPRRVESDPTSWQQETSVRTVTENAAYLGPGPADRGGNNNGGGMADRMGGPGGAISPQKRGGPGPMGPHPLSQSHGDGGPGGFSNHPPGPPGGPQQPIPYGPAPEHAAPAGGGGGPGGPGGPGGNAIGGGGDGVAGGGDYNRNGPVNGQQQQQQGGGGPRKEWRNSGWGRPNNGVTTGTA